VRLGQPLAEGAPEPAGLSEPVQQHQRRTRTAELGVEGHAA
jgi:hypothetical protein